MSKARRTTLTSWAAARRVIARIVERINADPALARAAMANPLFAAEEVGYDIDPAVRKEFEDRVRFTGEQVAELHRLRARIRELAGRDVDPDDAADLHALLFRHLDLPRRMETVEFDSPASLERLPQMGWAEKTPDPLEALRGQHELIDALLEYRALEASEPRLASREVFDAVRAGRLGDRVSSATIRLRSPQEDVS